ncbi:alpha-hydroxy-acid oxidizing protein [Microbacterium sp.]|uniref:alpha-hydroxy-acid oxidizing protein n=1 Tax=Microbacterium sp. TaxID=51671 RepID=UPI002810B5DD|nr:alpha-hydroxy-acid oxidizing protein [Microbacterium sp.]
MNEEHRPAKASTATTAHFGGVRERRFLALSSFAPTDQGYRRARHPGIWISNHGGRLIDRAVPTLAVLPEIPARVAGRVPIVFDSGVRSGCCWWSPFSTSTRGAGARASAAICPNPSRCCGRGIPSFFGTSYQG